MGNIVGSLLEVQQQLIIGCTLGDGYLRKKVNAHLEINHSVKQKEYVDWKYKVLETIVKTPPKAYKSNRGRVGYRFSTQSIPALTSVYDKFYKNGIKTIGKDLTLTPLSLAVWHMDDGSKSRNTCYFNTQQFDFSSQTSLINALKQFGINSTLNKDKFTTGLE